MRFELTTPTLAKLGSLFSPVISAYRETQKGIKIQYTDYSLRIARFPCLSAD